MRDMHTCALVCTRLAAWRLAQMPRHEAERMLDRLDLAVSGREVRRDTVESGPNVEAADLTDGLAGVVMEIVAGEYGVGLEEMRAARYDNGRPYMAKLMTVRLLSEVEYSQRRIGGILGVSQTNVRRMLARIEVRLEWLPVRQRKNRIIRQIVRRVMNGENQDRVD